MRDLNADNDIITTEEKPTRKGVKADVRKGLLLQKLNLDLWSRKVGNIKLIAELESISCQWERTKLTIYASRLLPSGHVLSYRKGEFTMPISSKYASDFAKLVMAIISLKRIVVHNYEKFALILDEKCKQELSYLSFSEVHDITFREDSTDINNSDDYEEDCCKRNFDADGSASEKLKNQNHMTVKSWSYMTT